MNGSFGNPAYTFLEQQINFNKHSTSHLKCCISAFANKMPNRYSISSFQKEQGLQEDMM